MEKSDYIELRQDQEDRRAKTVHLSVRGQGILLASKPLKLKFQRRVIDRIGDPSFGELMDLLQAIEAEFSR